MFKFPENADLKIGQEFTRGLSIEQYHSMKSVISSSGLRMFMDSPRRFKMYVDGAYQTKQTPAMLRGSKVHDFFLEPAKFKSNYVTMPEFTGKTKDGRDSAQSAEARAAKAAWLDRMLREGKTVTTQDEIDMMLGMCESIFEHKDVALALKGAVPEVSAFYYDQDTGLPCRVRPDILNVSKSFLIDLKTVEDCTKEAFSRQIWKHRWDIQVAKYAYAYEFITGERLDFVAFLAVEKTPPYECALWNCDNTIRETGEKTVREYMRRIKACADSGLWPRRQERAEDIGLPTYALWEQEYLQ